MLFWNSRIQWYDYLHQMVFSLLCNDQIKALHLSLKFCDGNTLACYLLDPGKW